MSDARSERRGAPRADANLPLMLSPEAGAQAARLQNISQSGLCCEFPDPLTEMTLMGIDIELPGGDAHRVEGIVVRCDKMRGVSPPTYEVAIYFTELKPETRRAITQYVLSQLGEGVSM